MATNRQELSADEGRRLRELALMAAEHSYSPYSRFRVGAALLLEDGGIVTGCNVENCSYRLTSCAEQGAIARAVAERGAGIRLRAVAVANLNGAASMPCGACRQTLAEFGGDETVVLYPGEGGVMEETTLGGVVAVGVSGKLFGVGATLEECLDAKFAKRIAKFREVRPNQCRGWAKLRCIRLI